MSEHDPLTVDDAKVRRDKILDRYKDRNLGDLRRVLATAEGRRLLWRVLVEAKIFRSCFDVNALTMAHNEGKRDIGIFIQNEILNASPEAIEKMRSEAASDRLVRDAELLKADKGDDENG